MQDKYCYKVPINLKFGAKLAPPNYKSFEVIIAGIHMYIPKMWSRYSEHHPAFLFINEFKCREKEIDVTGLKSFLWSEAIQVIPEAIIPE